MKPKAHDSVDVTLQEAYRVAYPLFTEARYQEHIKAGGKSKDFGGQLLIPKSSPAGKHFEKICIDVAAAAWPGRPLGEMRFPLSDGDAVAAKADGKKDWAKGHYLLRVKSPRKKGNTDELRRPPTVRHILDLKKTVVDAPYPNSGDYIGGMISFKGTEGNGNDIKDGVTCYVNDVVMVREAGPDEPRIGGKDYESAYETFKGVVGHVTSENPLTGETAPAKAASIF